MNINRIKQLAEQSKSNVDMGSYANKRAEWAYDPKNKNEHMWWGQCQPYYKFTYLLTKEYPGIYLEIGTHRGINLACAAAGQEGLPNRYTIGVDVDNHDDAIDVQRKFKNATFINGSSISKDTLKQVEDICNKTGLKISIIMIDACHKRSWVMTELLTYKHLFDEKAILMMDDIIFADNNTYLASTFYELPGEKVTFPELHTSNRVGIAVFNKQDQNSINYPTLTPEQMERGWEDGYKPKLTSWGDGHN